MTSRNMFYTLVEQFILTIIDGENTYYLDISYNYSIYFDDIVIFHIFRQYCYYIQFHVLFVNIYLFYYYYCCVYLSSYVQTCN